MLEAVLRVIVKYQWHSESQMEVALYVHPSLKVNVPCRLISFRVHPPLSMYLNLNAFVPNSNTDLTRRHIEVNTWATAMWI